MYTLRWQPPYDWAWILEFLRLRTVSGVEVITQTTYTRSFALGEHRGVMSAEPDEATSTLKVTLSDGLLPPQVITDALGDVGAARPGLRLPGCVDPFEQAIRAILGQLVSVAMAAKLTSRVAALYGDRLDEQFVLFPQPAQLAQADPLALKALGMPVKRAESLIFLAQSVLDGTFPLTMPDDVERGMKTLQTFPGIGRWTANYFALRGWQAKDVFLADDYLIKQRFAGMTPAQIRRYAERWQPWRSYALLHIWYTEGWQPHLTVS